jgi:hypothetical protein
MKLSNRFTTTSLSPKKSSAGIAMLLCAAYTNPQTLATALAASEMTRPVTWQRVVTLAQVNEPSTREAVNVTTLGQQEFANLGQLLNAGGKLVSPQQFKEEVAQRLIVGKLPSGASIEVMYASSGTIAGSLLGGGTGNASGGGPLGAPQNWPVSGGWTIDDSERVCASIRINFAMGSSIIPTACQFWFKLGGRYYVSDSDEDRSAKLFVRVLKQ